MLNEQSFLNYILNINNDVLNDFTINDMDYLTTRDVKNYLVETVNLADSSILITNKTVVVFLIVDCYYKNNNLGEYILKYPLVQDALLDQDIVDLIKLLKLCEGQFVKYSNVLIAVLDYNSTDTLVIPNDIIAIGSYAVINTKYKKIIVPDSVTIIGNNAFESNDNVETITLGKKVERIEANAFMDLPRLKHLNLPNSLKLLHKHFLDSGTCEAFNTLDIDASIDKGILDKIKDNYPELILNIK